MTGEQIRMSQGYDVLQPKSGEAYPIPCDEWDLLKNRLAQASDTPLAFHTWGSVLLGAAVTTAISIFVGALPATDSARIAAWAVVVGCAVCGGLCLYFAWRERQLRNAQVSDVVAQMELIERRYPRFTGAASPAQQSLAIAIRSARYGAQGRHADVTGVLRGVLGAQGLHLQVENDALGGDPCKGVAKKLVVEYVHNGTVHQKTIDEHDWLHVP